jgi:hypothetical protein
MSSNSNSENRDGNTGIAPPVTTDNMNAQFENVNIGTGESVATNAPVEESVGTSEPIISNAPMKESLAEEEEEDDAPAAAAAAAAAEPSTGTKRGLSDKQSAVQKLRAETLDDMRAKYANRFGNSAKYPKPPKAKAPMAAKLTKIRQEQGESAYERAMKNMMDEDDPLLGTNGKSRLAMRAVTQRKKKANSALGALNSRMNSMAPAAATAAATAAPLTAQSRNASNAVVESIAEMGRTAKGLIDTMIQTSKEMARGLAKSGNTAALTNASNIAIVGANNARGATVAPASMSRGTRKKKSAARLPTIFENTGNTNYMSPSAAPAYNAPSSKGSRRSRAKPKGPAEPYVPYVNETPLSANI